jgi:hypothetical protein
MNALPRTLLHTLCLMALLALVSACGASSGSPAPEEDPGDPSPQPLVLTGNTTTLAGDGTQAVTDSSDGTGATARFNFPRGMTTDGTYIYVSESTGNHIRKVDPVTGNTVSLAGRTPPGGGREFQDSTDGTGATAGWAELRHIVYHDGFLYTCDNGANRVRSTDVVTGNTTTLAGEGTAAFQDSTDGTGATAQFDRPSGITTDGTYLYVCDNANNRIRRVAIATGDTTTLAGNGAAANTESTDGTGATASINAPLALVYVAGMLYVTNTGLIMEVDATTGETTFLAGTDGPAAYQESTDGTGATARFSVMLGIFSDGFSLLVGDTDNNRIRRVDILTGNTTTLAGDGTQAVRDTNPPFDYVPPFPFRDSTDGTGATARFWRPRASVILNGALYVADGENHRIRKIE